MPVPTHGYTCQTFMYPTICWDCGESIHILQCTCGSVVRFDFPQPPWEQHDCSGGIGGSGYSGWGAVDILRANGAPITPSVLGKIFPDGTNTAQKPEEIPFERIEPEKGQNLNLLALVREVFETTKKTAILDNLGKIGRQMLGLRTPDKLRQITLTVNTQQPNLTYTCIVPESVWNSSGVTKDQMVFAQVSGHTAADIAIWQVNEIHQI